MMNLDEHTITEEALRRIEHTPSPRLKAIMTGLLYHLHAFAREVQLTEQEWLEGIQFLTRTGQISNSVRQEMILLSDTLGLSQLVVAQNHSRPQAATEQTVFGPFHVEGAPSLLTHGADIAVGASGDPLWVVANVVDSRGHAVVDALVDVWQADGDGFYDVQDEGWRIDESRLRAIFTTDGDGRFSFRSVMPTSYPIPMDGPVGQMMNATNRHPMRPAHIHFMIRKDGFDTLVTHVFADGDEYLDSDAVFGVRSSCIGTYVPHEEGAITPAGTVSERRFYTLDYTFVLHGLDER
ncbi:Hydroxyquinol 1,2-dioxygenase [Paraburkholderia aspalathi]|uniref:dioxygenase family protein n=1 Tax=Paraburkholderia aspalathi TaxID=1324617 RepID=UPI001B13AF1E|nr:dioxygenase [Paraburkholderia aspalathi]CAE6824341.1 Hydroxyquinol 1,2-dioxygenase [Paraburkholderia aspalathi]